MAVLAELFGSQANKTPKDFYLKGSLPVIKGLQGANTTAIDALNAALPGLTTSFNAIQGKQNDLLGQQESIFNRLLQRNQNNDPLSLYKGVGDTLFGYIKPQVLDPLANAEVNRFHLDNMARGITNNAYVQGTAGRLSDQNQMARVYADLAKTIYPQINPGFNQVFNAGLSSDAQSTGFVPQLMQMYQNQALSGILPALAGLQGTNAAAQSVGGLNQAQKMALAGFKQPAGNIFDKLGGATDSAMNFITQLYGMGGGGGMGKGEGGGAPTTYYNQVGGPGAAAGNHIGNINTPGEGWG